MLGYPVGCRDDVQRATGLAYIGLALGQTVADAVQSCTRELLRRSNLNAVYLVIKKRKDILEAYFDSELKNSRRVEELMFCGDIVRNQASDGRGISGDDIAAIMSEQPYKMHTLKIEMAHFTGVMREELVYTLERTGQQQNGAHALTASADFDGPRL